MAASELSIAWIYPDLLGTYGDKGNVTVLAERAQLRGITVRTVPVYSAQPIPLSCEIYVLGGGEDTSQELAAQRLRADGALGGIADRGGTVFGVCAGYQLLGTEFANQHGEPVAGAALLDVRSTRATDRAIGEVVTTPVTPLGIPALTGFENHRGISTPGPEARPLARVVTGVGNGNGTEGAHHRHVLGTYLHGPVLARNPALADLLLRWATGRSLGPLDDSWTHRLRTERLRSQNPGHPKERTR